MNVAPPPTTDQTGRTAAPGLTLLRDAAAAAVAHPGGQPWHIWPVDRGVELRVDGRGPVDACGAGGRTVRVSAGAAVLNLRLGMAALGDRPVVVLVPDPARPAVLAVLRRGVSAPATPLEQLLFDAVSSIRWFPPSVGDRPLPDGALLRLRAAAEAEGAWLRTVDGPTRSVLAAAMPAVGRLPAAARLMAVGGNHDVAVMQLKAGLAVQRVVLTGRATGVAVEVVGWPGDLAAVPRLPAPLVGRGSYPQVLVAVGCPAGSDRVPPHPR